jgi:peptidoglycan/LPS O-acetylase OafA/YrhL
MNPSHYRPEIDGLRAVAVLAVLLHHLAPALLPGGFVGVDIFFVISGFLITAQVYQDAGAGSFSLKRFYQRRINRIAPALVTVILVTLAAGFVLLAPTDLVLLARSAAHTLLAVSNRFFRKEYNDYFAADSGEAPLLHTWSLSIEEQFYLMWPLAMIALVKYSDRRYHLPLLGALTLVALGVSQRGVDNHSSYYWLSARLFELMIGGALALHTARARSLPRAPATVLAALGLALIAGSLAWLTPDSPFPGLNALWPCLGAALLIRAGNATPLAHLLSNRPMVFVGLLSYSLYLWHWPLIAYLHYADIDIGLGVGTGVGLAALLLAWLSWRYIETPWRRSGATLPFAPVFLRRFVLPCAAVAACAGITVHYAGFPARFDARVAAYEAALKAEPFRLRSDCHSGTDGYLRPPSESCRLGADKPVPDGLLIGDSFANHFSGMIDVMAKPQGLTFMDYTMNGCAPVLQYSYIKTPEVAARCAQRNAAAYALVASRQFRHVILAGNWPQDAEVGVKLQASVETLLGQGVQLTIIVNNQELRRAIRCPFQRVMYGLEASCDMARGEPPAYLAALKQRYPTIRFIDPNDVICAGGICRPVLDDVLLYRDVAHLNDRGSRLIGQSLLKAGVTL